MKNYRKKLYINKYSYVSYKSYKNKKNGKFEITLEIRNANRIFNIHKRCIEAVKNELIMNSFYCFLDDNLFINF